MSAAREREAMDESLSRLLTRIGLRNEPASHDSFAAHLMADAEFGAHASGSPDEMPPGFGLFAIHEAVALLV
jgi:hypothetical protein